MLGDTGPRWRGIRAIAQLNGFELDPKLIVDLPESRDPNAGFEAGFRLTEELLKRKRPFTALMAFDDLTAFGAIRALTKSGMRVPDDCSVIGFDDVAAATLYTPSLTTVRQPMEYMGTMAVGILLESINAGQENREFSAAHHRVAPELVVRESTKALR
jgi:LacI family transcriptional regulator